MRVLFTILVDLLELFITVVMSVKVLSMLGGALTVGSLIGILLMVPLQVFFIKDIVQDIGNGLTKWATK